MSQPDASKLHGSWKALFLCPNPKIVRELSPLLSRLLANFTPQELNVYPYRHQLGELLATESPNLCFLEITDQVDRGLSIIPEMVRLDPKVPIVAVLSSDNPELVLRCLRQGASDFLIQPFTAEQLEATLRKIARLHPVPLQESRKSLLRYAGQRRLRRQHHRG